MFRSEVMSTIRISTIIIFHTQYHKNNVLFVINKSIRLNSNYEWRSHLGDAVR